MKHPAQKFIQLQYIMMGLAFLFGGIALFKTSLPIFILLMFYALALSFIFEGITLKISEQKTSFLHQWMRALLIIVFVTILYF